MPEINRVITAATFPNLFDHFKNAANLPSILRVIDNEFSELFDLDALESCAGLRSGGPLRSNHFRCFVNCVKPLVGTTLYLDNEILARLAPSVFGLLNGKKPIVDIKINSFYIQDENGVVKGRQKGFYERLANNDLTADPNDREAMQGYALGTLDMIRTVAGFQRLAKNMDKARELKVVELRHISYLKDEIDLNKTNQTFFVRCQSQLQRGCQQPLSQWATIYYIDEDKTWEVYSESPLVDQDKRLINEFFESQGVNIHNVHHAGQDVALSITSGIRAICRMNDHIGGAGLTITADMTSLFIELAWLWVDPRGFSNKLEDEIHGAADARFSWAHFKHTGLMSDKNGFRILNFAAQSNPNVNRDNYTQQRAFIIGMPECLQDKRSNELLSIDRENGVVTLRVPDTLNMVIRRGSDSYVYLDGEKTINLPDIYAKHGDKSNYKTIGAINLLSKRSPNAVGSVEETVAGIVLQIFRACAKLKVLDIDMPLDHVSDSTRPNDRKKIKLNQEEIDLICYFMEIQNPFVCELRVKNNHPSLMEIKGRLLHIFARNRWLHERNYQAPLFASYWHEAAVRWLDFLLETPDLLCEKSESKVFRSCVQEMGVHGLEPLLDYLKQYEATIKVEFSRLREEKVNPPAFYAACPDNEVKAYTALIKRHLVSYFPFKRFYFRFAPGEQNAHHILELFTAFSQSDKGLLEMGLVECLSLPNEPVMAQAAVAGGGAAAPGVGAPDQVLAQRIEDLDKFLDIVITRVTTEENWNCAFRIPELDEPSSDLRVAQLSAKYKHIGNILINRACRSNCKELSGIPFVPPLQADMQKDGMTYAADSNHADDHTGLTNSLTDADSFAGGGAAADAIVKPFASLTAERRRLENGFVTQVTKLKDSTFSFERAGGTALERQQQMQVQQKRSQCLDHEIAKGKAYEELLPAKLVTFETIDKVMGTYYQAFSKEHQIDPTKWLVNAEAETDLQRFFSTWVSANVQTSARYIIRKMTPDAVKMLLKYHRQLISGLRVGNLPKGFYTQRDISGELVLGYKPGLPYATDYTKLTLHMRQLAPKIRSHMGDFRQLNEHKYLEGIRWDADDLKLLKLFSQLQPPFDKGTVDKAFGDFMALHGQRLKIDVSLDEETIKQHWHLFDTLRMLDSHDDAGIKRFIELSKKGQLTHDVQTVFSLLFDGIRTHHVNLGDWAMQAFDSAASGVGEKACNQLIRALGELCLQYRQDGEQPKYGLMRFIAPLYRMDTRLGRDFFKHFLQHYLLNCETFIPLLTGTALEILDNMTDYFLEEPDAKGLWQAYLQLHMEAVGWEALDDLWQGFHYFYSNLKEQALQTHLTPHLLLAAMQSKPQNMLVFFDRLLSALRSLYNQEQKKALITNLPSLDWSEGGVAYAICHESFSIVSPDLQLHSFLHGKPTYAVNMSDLWGWEGEPGALYLSRLLASHSGFKPADYDYARMNLVHDCSLHSKYNLLWVLHAKFTDIRAFHNQLKQWENAFIQNFATHFYHVFYHKQHANMRFPLPIYELVEQYIGGDYTKFDVVTQHDSVIFLECLNALYGFSNQDGDALLNQHALERVVALCRNAPQAHPHLEDGLKLASVFFKDAAALGTFYETTTNLLPITRREWKTLFNQLMSIDLNDADPALLEQDNHWQAILSCIKKIENTPMRAHEHRVSLMGQLMDQGLRFTTSVAGDYRKIKDGDLEVFTLNRVFEHHHDRIHRLLTRHIVISEAKLADGESKLTAIIDFFKRLQLNKTCINELEPLLSKFEVCLSALVNHFWTDEYFLALLQSLQPKDANASYPFSLLEAVLSVDGSMLIPKKINELELTFPKDLKDAFDLILSKSESFTRLQQAMLATLVMKVVQNGMNAQLIHVIIEQLTASRFASLRSTVLTYLMKASEQEIDQRFKQCEMLVGILKSVDEAHHVDTPKVAAVKSKSAAVTVAVAGGGAASGPAGAEAPLVQSNVVRDGSDTCELWINTLTDYPNLAKHFLEKCTHSTLSKTQQYLILHIVAWSSFRSEQLPSVAKRDYVSRMEHSEAYKLMNELTRLEKEELKQLADCYPHIPAPDTVDLLRIIQKRLDVNSPQAINASILAFLTVEQTRYRRDYQRLSVTREQDLRRMLNDTYITRGSQNQRLSPEQRIRMVLMFKSLKQIELGEQFVSGASKPVYQMTEAELSTKFQELSVRSVQDPTNDCIKTQIWAVLFDAIGRTTQKYPHLAQQLALFVNEVVVDEEDRSTISQLKTGEGKTHYIALQAARLAGLGKKVDICTAKDSLAWRDRQEYIHFFEELLSFKTANITPRTPLDVFQAAHVVYATPGGYSLFIDEQASQGHVISFSPTERVFLGDEFDHLYFSEGQNTQYNHAKLTGIMPKDMAWFYDGINDYFETRIQSQLLSEDDKIDTDKLKSIKINSELLSDCFAYLSMHATEEGLCYLEGLHDEPMILVGWLQSAYDVACKLKKDVDYTVRLEDVSIGDETIPMLEIYPLTKDMQLAVGSTFSHGTHQLLAAFLNKKAREHGGPQNYHVHPESKITSSQVISQRLKQLWGGRFAGYTGTITDAQALQLHADYRTAVLHVPTNERERRYWSEASFYDNKDTRLRAIVDDIRAKLDQKQSVLWCCSTDREVREVMEDLRKNNYFTENELTQYFLSYTNEEHKTSAEVITEKTKKEGRHRHLGTRTQGVVLVAACFGRGDNLDVEQVILTTVSDESDRLQKGGRTARDGAHGQVSQYYIEAEVKQAFTESLIALKMYYARHECTVYQAFGFVNENQDLLSLLNQHNGEWILNEPVIHQTGLTGSKQFDITLRLKAFFHAIENRPSLAYHELKAELSSLAISSGEQTDDTVTAANRVNQFAAFLAQLERQWMCIQERFHDPDDKITELYDFVKTSEATLQSMFQQEDLKLTCRPPESINFIAKSDVAPLTDQMYWLSAIEHHLLRQEGLPGDVRLWKEMSHCLTHMDVPQLEALNSKLECQRQLSSQTMSASLEAIAHAKKSIKAAEAAYNTLDGITKLYRILRKANDEGALVNELTQISHAMGDESLGMLETFLCETKLLQPVDHVKKALPLLLYLSQMNASLQVKAAFLQDIVLRDELVRLPVACFAKPIIVIDANNVFTIKRFVDRFIIAKQNEATYVRIFRFLLEGNAEHTELRFRLFTAFEAILEPGNPPQLRLHAPQLLLVLSELMFVFRAAANHAFFANLVEMMAGRYAKASQSEHCAVLYEELDQFWSDLLAHCPDMLNSFERVDRLLNKQDEYGFERFAQLVKIPNSQLLFTLKDELFNLWDPNAAEGELDQLKTIEMALNSLQHWYAAKPSPEQKVGLDCLKHYLARMQPLNASKILFLVTQLQDTFRDVADDVLLDLFTKKRLNRLFELSLTQQDKYTLFSKASKKLSKVFHETKVGGEVFYRLLTTCCMNDGDDAVENTLTQLVDKASAEQLKQSLLLLSDQNTNALTRVLELIVAVQPAVDLEQLQALLKQNIQELVSLSQNKPMRYGTFIKIWPKLQAAWLVCSEETDEAPVVGEDAVAGGGASSGKDADENGLSRLIACLQSEDALEAVWSDVHSLLCQLKAEQIIQALSLRFKAGLTPLCVSLQLVSATKSSVSVDNLAMLLTEKNMEVLARLYRKPERYALYLEVWRRDHELFLQAPDYFRLFLTYISQCDDLTSRIFAHVCTQSEARARWLAEHVDALNCLITYFNSRAFTRRPKGITEVELRKQVSSLCDLLEFIDKEKIQPHQNQRVDYYRGLAQWAFGDADLMQQLFTLIHDFPNRMGEIAFSDIAKFLAECQEDEFDVAYQVIRLFYSNRDAILTYFNDRLLKLRDDESNARKALLDHQEVKKKKEAENKILLAQKERIMWLKLLNSDVLLPSPDYPLQNVWTRAQNDELLKNGFVFYTDHAKAILFGEAKIAAGGVYAEPQRIFSNQGRKALSDIVNELAMIGEYRPLERPRAVTPDPRQGLYHAVQDRLNGYQATWFKSQKNKDRLAQISRELSDLLHAEDFSPSDLLRRIVTFKRRMVTEDVRENQNSFFRRYVKPLHQSGQSRLWDTLNDIQGMILTYWSTTPLPQEILLLSKHRPVSEAAYEGYATEFVDALRIWLDANHIFGHSAAAKLYGMLSPADPQPERSIVNILQAHPELVNALPGELRVYARDVMTFGQSDEQADVEEIEMN